MPTPPTWWRLATLSYVVSLKIFCLVIRLLFSFLPGPGPTPARVFLQPPGTTGVNDRIEVTSNPQYRPIVHLVHASLQHLRTSLAARSVMLMVIFVFFDAEERRQAFRRVHGAHSFPTDQFIIEYFTKNPPDVIIRDLPDTKSAITWGAVEKGTHTTGMRNEVFLSKELVDHLLNSTDPMVSIDL
jgi:hypothetical protein